MTALTLARTEVGDAGGIPPGASVSVSPEGNVTIQDAVGRRTFKLAPDAETSLREKPAPRRPTIPAEEVPRTPSVPAPAPSVPAPASAESSSAASVAPAANSIRVPKPSTRPPAKPKKKNHTVAYDARELGVYNKGVTGAAAASEPKKNQTIAYDARQMGFAAPESASEAPAQATPSEGASEAAPQQPETAKSTPAKSAPPSKTIAYDARELGLMASSATEAASPKSAPPNQTIAYDARELGLTSPSEAQDAPANQTIAYDARELGLAASAAEPTTTEPKPRKEKSAAKRTVAFDASELDLRPPASRADAGARSAADGQSESDPSTETVVSPKKKTKKKKRKKPPTQTVAFEASQLGDVAAAKASHATPAAEAAKPGEDALRTWELLHERDEEPSDASPLRYRERVYVVPSDASEPELEAILMARFEELHAELSAFPKGKLVNMALFDHKWTGRPERPPRITLQWKDWRGEPIVSRPSDGTAPSTESQPPAQPQPPAVQSPAVQSPAVQSPAVQSQPPAAQSQPPAAQSQPPTAQ
ncbi:MAG: hypothetical protein AB8I08_22875, partial [Sandaracinaceae bacterium]